MKHNKLSFIIHFALRNPQTLKYWDMPAYKDTGLPYPQGVWVTFIDQKE